MVDLQKIRKEWAQGPIDGPDPHEVEKRFPKDEDMYVDPLICIIENCNAEGFRGQPRCKQHHLEWCAEKEAEGRRREEEWWKRRNKKSYADEEAQNAMRNVPYCSNCGTYTQFSDRVVRLKPKNKRPKKPTLLREKYEMLCIHCAK
jgi:hypothetical protein